MFRLPSREVGRGDKGHQPAIQLCDWGFELQGTCVAIGEAGLCDIESLDALAAQRICTAFAALSRSLDTTWQLLMQVRPYSPPDSERGEGDQEDTFWRQLAGEQKAFTRRLYILLSGQMPEKLLRHRKFVASILKTVGISYCPLDKAQIAELLSAANVFDHAIETAKSLRTGRIYRQSLEISRWPTYELAATWLKPVLAVNCECDISLQFDPIPRDIAIGKLSRHLRDLHAERLFEVERGTVPSVHLSTRTESTLALRSALAADSAAASRFLLCISARGKSVEATADALSALQTAIRITGCSFKPAWFRQGQAALTAAPVCRSFLEHPHLMDAHSVSAFLPWVVDGLYPTRGYHLGLDRQHRTPLVISPFDKRRQRNGNIGIYAASGHGKSYTVGAILLQAHRYGVGALIIDPEGEYESVTKAIGGQYIPLEAGAPHSINPLEIGSDDEEIVSTVIGLTAVLMDGRIDESDRGALTIATRQVISTAREQMRVPLLSDCLNMLQRDLPKAALALERLTYGAWGSLFNRPTTRVLRGTSLAFGLRRLDRDFLPAAAYLLGRRVWFSIRDDPRPRHIVFDEVGLLAGYSPIRELLVQLARRCRKYQASLVVATQNVQDLLRSDDGSVVATNCASVFLGNHRATETKLMQRTFDLTDAQTAAIAQATRGEFLLVQEQRRTSVEVIASPNNHRILVGG